jgi:ribosomal protein S18 acetylase RimI-like enzyme
MIEIIEANNNQLDIVQDIAQKTWPIAYKDVISSTQIEYMLDMMYSKSALEKQMQEKKHHFILAKKGSEILGFASYELDCDSIGKTKIHKLYVLPETQGSGIGVKLVDFLSEKAKANNQSAVFLNVNKYNSAQFFYKKIGFSITKEEVIDIGNGYIMDDFVMEKLLK